MSTSVAAAAATDPTLLRLTTNDMLALCQLDTAQLELELQHRGEQQSNGGTQRPLVAVLRACDTDQRTLLHWAALQGRREHVEYLLEVLRKNGAVVDAVDALDDTGNTPLNLASLKGDDQICSWLLAAGAAVNTRNARGHSPLQYACSKGHTACVRLLLAAGADLQARDSIGNTVFHRMAGLNRDELLRLVLEAAAERGCQAALLAAQNEEGDTALHVACQDECDAAAVLLVQAGARMDVLNKEEQTAVQVAKPGLRRKLLEEQQRLEVVEEASE